MNNSIQKAIQKAVNDGIILGIKESKNILNDFIDTKISHNKPGVIFKYELNEFLDMYIKELIEQFKTEQNENTRFKTNGAD